MLKRALTLDDINIMQLQLQQILKQKEGVEQRQSDLKPVNPSRSRQVDQDSVTSDSSVCQVMFSCEPVVTVS